ncbi:MAG TPA: hypothetical protein VIR58_05545 [Acidimicrobiales bacterium]
MTIAENPADLLGGGVPAAEREERLEAGAATLTGRTGAPSILLNERFLVGVAGALTTAGLVAIILGWLGASHSILVVKQIPYLISGGLLGVALATLGGLAYFTHWLAVLLREIRAQEGVRRQEHAELIATIREERAADHQRLVEAIRDLRRPRPLKP